MTKDLQTSNINQLESEIILLKQQTAQNIIEIGKRLIQAKEQLPHGEWLPWLEEKIDFSRHTANRFMRVAEEFSNVSMLQHLTQSKIFALLDVPESQREEFIESNPVEDMTTRELRQAIKERKEAEQRAAELEKENERLKNQPPKVIEREVKKTIEVVPEDYEKLKQQEKDLEEEISTLKEKLKYQVDPQEYERLRRELTDKNLEVYDLKKEKEQMARVDSQTRHEEKLRDNVLVFTARIHTFINDVGGLAWLTEYINELDDYDKKSYLKAVNLVESWALTIKANIRN